MSWDREDFDKHYTHILATHIQDNLVKVEIVEFGFVDHKEFDGYLDTVDIVSLWEFSSSQHKVGYVVPVPYHKHFDPVGFE